MNGDYLINSKQTLATRYFYSRDPQIQSLGGLLPGSPSILYYSNTNAVAKLTSLVTSSFINEVHSSFQRNLSVQNAAAPPGATNESLGITPMTPGVHPPPGIILISGGYNLMGIFGPSFSPTTRSR